MQKNNFIAKFLIFLIIVLVILTFNFTTLLTEYKDVSNDLYEVEYLSSTTQRLVRLYISDNLDTKFIYYIDDQTQDALSVNSSDALTVLKMNDFAFSANEIYQSWDLIYKCLNEDEIDKIALILASDNHFYQITDFSLDISNYMNKVFSNIMFFGILILICIALIGWTIAQKMLQLQLQIKINNELAQVTLVDMYTGLYNRQKCQELLKTPIETYLKNQSAIIVFDLNSMKEVNAKLGSRIGDELIHNFANALKKSCSISVIQPFIGRLGGDEFIVFYEDIESEFDVKSYLKELQFLSKELNSQEDRYQIKYSFGYAINSHNNDNVLSVRELFDKADSIMYSNKMENKKNEINI